MSYKGKVVIRNNAIFKLYHIHIKNQVSMTKMLRNAQKHTILRKLS